MFLTCMKVKILAADKRRRIKNKGDKKNKTFLKIESLCEQNLRVMLTN